MKPIRVLVVDDSYFMRSTISKIITTDQIQVIGTAKNGREAVLKVIELKPDVVTMDIEMPVMTGLEALKEIMQKAPVPVLMLSTLTSDGADSTMEALSNGAVDFITKKAAFTEMYGMKEELIHKITQIGHSSSVRNRIQSRNKLFTMSKTKTKSQLDDSTDSAALSISKRLAEKSRKKTDSVSVSGRPRPPKEKIQAIIIGVSTGGPVALQNFIPSLPARLPVGILIVQHMPPIFTKSLAERLNMASHLKVKEAEEGDRVLPGHVYMAPGGLQMRVSRQFKIMISDNTPEGELYKPSVNVTTRSMITAYRSGILGIMMTGMGHDGGKEFKRLHDMGGYILSQDLDTCVVSGMTQTVIDSNAVDEIHPLPKLAEAIAGIFGLRSV